MEDNFDNEFKKHGDAYKVQPREWVWPRVEAELEKEKDRRIVAWWWMLPVAALLLGGGYWLIDSKKVDGNTTVAASTAVEKNGPATDTVRAEEKSSTATSVAPSEKAIVVAPAVAKEIVAATPNTKALETTKAFAAETKNTTNTVVVANKKTTVFATKKTAVKDNTDNARATDLSYLNTTKKLEKEPTLTTATSEEKTVTKENILSSGGQAKPADDSEDRLLDNSTVKQITENKNTKDSGLAKTEENTVAQKNADTTEIKTAIATENAPPNIAPKPKQPFKKETVWTINAGVGTTNNKNGLGLSNLFSLEQKMYADMPQYNSGTGTNAGSCQSCNASTLPLLSSKPGINITLSVARSQWINSRWLWQAELGWQYQQMQQRYGGRKDSTVFYSNLNAAAYSYYYQSGSTSSATGYNHRLFISNQIAFAMLKNRGLRLSVGLYGGWNISNNYLIPDKTNYRFVDAKNLYSKGFIGGEMGIKYVLKSNWSVGLNGKVDFTRSFTPPDGNKQYWKSWQLQAGIPISTIKQLFKK